MENMQIVIALGGVAALSAVFLLPARVEVERRRRIAASPSEVFRLVEGAEAFQSINPYATRDKKLAITIDGPVTGVGSRFSFAGREGKGTQTITAISRDRSVDWLIDMGPMGRPTQRIEIEETGEGSDVRWTAKCDFGLNPVGRLVGTMMDGYLGRVFEQGLDNIAAAATQPAHSSR